MRVAFALYAVIVTLLAVAVISANPGAPHYTRICTTTTANIAVESYC